MKPFMDARVRILGVLLGLLWLTGAQAQTTWYVKPTATGNGNGRSWNNAFLTLTQAIDSATSGDQVWVAAGTYKPTTGTDRTASFLLKAGVKWYGGFNGNESNLSQRQGINVSNVSILDGNIGQTATDTDNVYHVVKATLAQGKPRIDGFTIRGGYANGLMASQENEGGGIYTNVVFSSTDTIFVHNCVIRNNYAETDGAAIQHRGAFGPWMHLTNCLITDNVSGVNGRCISNLNISMHMENNVITRNTCNTVIVSSNGNSQAQRLVMLHNTVAHNKSTNTGGEVVLFLGNIGSSYVANNILWFRSQFPHSERKVISFLGVDTFYNNLISHAGIDILGGSTTVVQSGNIFAEPQVNQFTLTPKDCSPVFGAALPESSFGRTAPSRDYAGNLRPAVNTAGTIGAYHFNTQRDDFISYGAGDTLVNPGKICLDGVNNTGFSVNFLPTGNKGTPNQAILYRNGVNIDNDFAQPWSFARLNDIGLPGTYWLAFINDCDTTLSRNAVSIQGENPPSVVPFISLQSGTGNIVVNNTGQVGLGVAYFRIVGPNSFVNVQTGGLNDPYVPTQNGQYFALFYNASLPGCYSDTSNIVTVGTTAVDPGLRASLNVYPNPVAAQGQVNVQFEAAQAGEATFRLQNTLGQTLREERITCTTGVQTHRMELGALPAGVYYLQVQTAGGASATLPLRVN